jgi:predicted nuclease with TOPRIM domain
MIEKEVKKYARTGAKGYNYRINLSKQDNLNGTVSILTVYEYKSLQNQISSQHTTIAKQDKKIKGLYSKIDNHDELQQKIELLGTENEMLEKRNDKLITENTELLRQNKYFKKELTNIEDMTNKFNILIKDLQKQHDNAIEKLNKENISQLKESYDKFNEDLTKYITLNQLQNTALKRILELGFIELIRNKHKKIAKANIKKIDNKPVLEYVLKEKD